MFPIVEAEFLAPDVKRLVVEAPRVARKRKAGQFVILRLHDRGERIPLTIADSDPGRGTITIIVQGVGKTTKLLNMLGTGDAILDLVGPLGTPSHVERFGTVVVIGGGLGAAIAYPTAKAMKEAGNHVVAIVGARNKELVILEEEIAAISDELLIATDDGSYGRRGFVTDVLRDRMESGGPIDLVLAIGPPRMMQAVAETTRPRGIKTVVSLNSLMVDGTGMCGGCRVLTNAGARFACVDGPEFDAHEVDFETLVRRNRTYLKDEADSLRRFLEHPEAELEKVRESCRLEQRHPEARCEAGRS
ncbi:MAG: ferredoxin-NADP reductase [Planctomycetales bacterium 71-10]|nr:MAG: ferredoxin-NADP reductase [Planctomycetales bacterium 71-10]